LNNKNYSLLEIEENDQILNTFFLYFKILFLFMKSYRYYKVFYLEST